MNRVKAVIVITAVIFLASVVMVLCNFKPSEKRMAEVVQDGNVIYTFDLSIEKDQTIVVKSPDGSSSNIIEIKDGEIFMADAECSDKVCVKSGVLKYENMPIVCLPNKLIIRYCEE